MYGIEKIIPCVFLKPFIHVEEMHQGVTEASLNNEQRYRNHHHAHYAGCRRDIDIPTTGIIIVTFNITIILLGYNNCEF